MKKSLVALAVLGALTGAAQASDTNVTLYGTLDVGIMSASKNTTSAGSVIGCQDTQIAPSVYGLKGNEDLGGGLNAGFDLQGGMNVCNGQFGNEVGGIFGREAKVTLGGDWGTVGFGLQVDPALIAAISTEPRKMAHSLGDLELFAKESVANNSPQGLSGGLFDRNALQYSYSGNGLYVGALYSFGGVAGSTSAASAYSLGLTYTNVITVSAGYVAQKNNNVGTNGTGTSGQISSVGLAWENDMFAVRFQWDEFKFNYGVGGVSGATNDVKVPGIGFDWKAGANTLNLSFYDAKDSGPGVSGSTVAEQITGGSTKEFALLDMYSLSKRTMVFGQVAFVKADSNAGASADLSGIAAYVYTPGGAAAAGSNTTYVGVGVQHTF